MPPATRVVVRAPAKINLSLEVTGVRPDGFHLLRTVFLTLDLHDTLTCIARPGPFAITCRMPGVPLGPENLIWRAAGALWRRAGRTGAPEGVHVSLAKRIPAQAGLGGGSADAAAALVALSRLWRLPFSKPELAAIGATLGADVPFFLWGGAGLGLGRGDEIFPLADPARRVPVALVLPEFGVSTPEAYGWYDEEPGRAERTVSCLLQSSWPPAVATIGNDLEPAVARRHPGILEAKRALTDAGAEVAAMSGSGSAVFGLFESERKQSSAIRQLRAAGWRAVGTRSLPRKAGRGWPAAGPREGDLGGG